MTTEPVAWIDGFPKKPWADEWFIAITTFGDRVALIALPEEYSYDFKTADDTYIKADKIKCWMQFPDSEFLHPPQQINEELLAALKEIRDLDYKRSAVNMAAFKANGIAQEAILKAEQMKGEGK